MCLHVHVCVYVCLYECVYEHVCMCEHACTYASLGAHVFRCMHVCKYMSVCLCVCVHVCVCMCVCVHACVAVKMQNGRTGWKQIPLLIPCFQGRRKHSPYWFESPELIAQILRRTLNRGTALQAHLNDIKTSLGASGTWESPELDIDSSNMLHS